MSAADAREGGRRTGVSAVALTWHGDVDAEVVLIVSVAVVGVSYFCRSRGMAD
jgi:hypothetical protein